MGVWYATREDVMFALDVAEAHRSVAQIDRCIEAASRSVERLCHRYFYPTTATRYLDWPTNQLGTSYRIYLDSDHELTAVTTLASGGTAISSSDYFLEPHAGPPYTRIELDRSSAAQWAIATTPQRTIAITGQFGACADVEQVATLAEALDTTETAVDVGSSIIGVGDLLLIDSEYMQVTARAALATGATLSANLTANPGTSPTLTGSYTLTPGEVITVDSERMLVTDVVGSTAIVERAWSGSVLAAHSSGATVYAPRTLTVTRAQLGTTAASHSSGATVYKHTPPGLVRQLTIAEALVSLAREQSGYARTVGTGEGERNASSGDIRDLREQVYWAHGRKTRKAAV